MWRKPGFWLLPPVCLICGQRAELPRDCCAGCQADLPVIEAACQRCGQALAQSAVQCGRCLRKRPAFDRTWAGYAFAPVAQGLVHRFKYQRDLAAGRVLASLLAQRLVLQGALRPQALVPVPLHWRRQLRRGFNQAEYLAADLSRQLGGIPVMRALQRRRATRTQSDLPAGQRAANVRAAFAARSLPPGLSHVALVDDVMTTGATLDACAAQLKQAGVKRVELWVVARA